MTLGKCCRYQSGNTAGCAAMKKRLQEIDFAIVETALYLDAYPTCEKALAYYHKLIAEREQVAAGYHSGCGPTTAWDNKSTTAWDWVKGPWPWSYDAN